MDTLFDLEQFMKKDISKQLTDIRKEIYLMVNNLYVENKAVWIPGNVPSLKNSKEIVQMYTKQSICCNAEVKGKGKDIYCSKCHKRTQRKKRSSLIASKTVREYQKQTQQQYIDARNTFMKCISGNPYYRIGLYIIRNSMRHYDFNNASHIVHDIISQDMMEKVKGGGLIRLMPKWIDDDDTKNLMPVAIGTHVDKENTGCYIVVLNKQIYEECLLYNLTKLKEHGC